jgi:hypothetical protein
MTKKELIKLMDSFSDDADVMLLLDNMGDQGIAEINGVFDRGDMEELENGPIYDDIAECNYDVVVISASVC